MAVDVFASFSLAFFRGLAREGLLGEDDGLRKVRMAGRISRRFRTPGMLLYCVVARRIAAPLSRKSTSRTAGE